MLIHLIKQEIIDYVNCAKRLQINTPIYSCAGSFAKLPITHYLRIYFKN